MPFLSFSPALTSGVRWLPSAAQARGPWRTQAVGCGCGDSSQNKLVGRRDLVKLGASSPCSFCSHGGGRGVHGEFVSSFRNSAVASETGLRRWIRGRYDCSFLSSSSSIGCGGATAPFDAHGRWRLAAGLDRAVVDCSGRKAASILPAKVPNGRQIGDDWTFAASSSGCRWRSGGESIFPSGDVPGEDDFGSRSKLWRRRARSKFSAPFQGLFCKVLGLSCNFIFLRGPSVSCTLLRN